jgi:glucosamine 6-phosphate synthetase-like amidotransferase/phosphosugar isomerase protein
MCQLAAYIGERRSASLLLKALENQEPLYGGHATGMGVINGDQVEIVKGAGPVEHVKSQKPEIKNLDSCTVLAHSRYSSNARDNPDYNLNEMAHPFISDDGKIALMHNGVISNYKELWKKLDGEHTFRSYGEKVDDITDSEVAVHMLSDAFNNDMSMIESFQHITPKLKGTFLLAAINTDDPDAIYIANWYQPCYVALGKEEALFVSSRRGLNGLTEHLDRVFQPPKNSITRLTRLGADIHVMDDKRKVPPVRMNVFEARKKISKSLKEKGPTDVRELFHSLQYEGWAEVYNMPVNAWKDRWKTGVYVMNPYFELLEDMVMNGDLLESIDLRREGGIEDVPRFKYSLA